MSNTNVTDKDILEYNVMKSVVNIFGMAANLIILFILFFKKSIYSKLTSRLLKLQCIFDLLVCLFSAIHVLETPRWKIGDDILDVILCSAWHNQAPFWSCVTFSIVNLNCIAVDRYWLVVVSIKYSGKERRRFVYCMICLIVSAMIFGPFYYMFGKYVDGKCLLMWKVSEKIVKPVNATLFLLLLYLLPCIFQIGIYTKVVTSLNSRGSLSKCEASTVAKRVRQFTLTCICITITFITTLSINAMCYFASCYGWLDYSPNTHLYSTAIFFISLNSAANPIIMFIFITSIRRHIISLFLMRSCRGIEQISTHSHHESKTGMSSNVEL